jgi:hypothetical protein
MYDEYLWWGKKNILPQAEAIARIISKYKICKQIFNFWWYAVVRNNLS